MPPPANRLPPPDTLPSLLLMITALSGEIPPALVNRLSDTSEYKSKVVKSLKQKKLIRTFYRDGLRGLRLTAKAKHLLLANYPSWFQSTFTGSTETNALSSAITRRLRLHRMAEVLVTMRNAGISSFPWEKPAVFQPVPPADLWLDDAAYYSSREIKEIGPQGTKIRGSRATGVLLTGAAVFVIYNTAATQMKWEYRAEIRLKALLQMEVCRSRLSGQLMSAAICGIVFGDSMAQMEYLMTGGSGNHHNYFVLDGNFEHFYYLTNDHRGEAILQLLCDTGLKESLDNILSENLSASRPDWPVENDAMDDRECPVLFGYTCDMPRIRRFDTALELHGQTGTIFCFDFQAETIHRLCGSRVTLQSIDFEAYERSVFHIPQATD